MSSFTRNAKRRVADPTRHLAWGLLCLAGQVQAGDALPLTGEAIPSVITATRLQQSMLDVPASVTVIDQAMIRAAGAREIPDLLRQVPGLIVSREDGSTAFVSQNGLAIGNARRMQVLIDGRSIYGAGLAQVDWFGMPVDVDDIERIEVVRGPNSAAYGANSFLGVINIITRHPSEVPVAELRWRQGANGVGDAYGRLGLHGLGADWSWSLFHREDDGFFDRNNKNPARPYYDGKQVDGLRGRGIWYLPSDGQLQVGVGGARMDAQQPRLYDPGYVREVPVEESENSYVSLDLDQPLNDRHRLKMAISASWSVHRLPLSVRLPYLAVSPELRALYDSDPALAERFVSDPAGTCGSTGVVTNAQLRAVCLRLADSNYTTNRDYVTDINYHELRRDMEVSDTWVPDPRFRAVLGWHGTLATADSRTYLNAAWTSQVNSFFAHGEWHLAPHWLLNLGGSEEVDSLSGNNFSPRVALSWHPTDNQVLRLIHSRAVRTPDILEQRANWHYYATTIDRSQSQYDGVFYQSSRSDGTARTEHIRSSELSYFGQHQPSRLSGDVRLFHNELDLVVNNIAIDTFTLSPTQHHVLDGAELGGQWQFTPLQRLTTTYSRLHISKPPETDNTYYVPKNAGSLGWMFQDPEGWRASVVYGFYDNLPERYHYDRVDMHLGRIIPVGTQKLDVGLTVWARLGDEPELRSDNGLSSRYKGWLSAGWRY